MNSNKAGPSPPDETAAVPSTRAAVPEFMTQVSKDEVATLTLPDGRVYELAVFHPTIGPEVLVDIRTLYSQGRVMTFDPGFNSTAACQSAITFIDGEQGMCLYRGFPVHELVKRCSFLDVCYLVLYGHLPQKEALISFRHEIQQEMLLHEQLRNFVASFIHGSHPMSMLACVVSAMASFYVDPMHESHIATQENRELACVQLIAKMPMIVGMIFKNIRGEPVVYPRADLSYAENVLNMMFSTPMEEYRLDPIKVKVIEAFLIIHADHEQNASTSTVRTAGSSMANPYACIATGITSLWGRAHGGANEAVIKMLREIKSVSNIADFITKVKSKEVRLMGFGHRIYRNYDPRAACMRDLCHELFDKLGMKDPLFDIAIALEKVAMEDEYFKSRKLYPNVDFYSGIVMRGLGIPENMFTVMFALGRSVGWLAHWKEMVDEKQMKITRPRQLYVGAEKVLDKDLELVDTTLASRKPSEHRRGDSFSCFVHPGKTFHEIQAKVSEMRAPRLIVPDRSNRTDLLSYGLWGESEEKCDLVANDLNRAAS